MNKAAILATFLAVISISASAQPVATHDNLATQKTATQQKSSAQQKRSTLQITTTLTFQGKWHAARPFFQMSLLQHGNKLEGDYSTSPYEDGRKVQDGAIEGIVKGKTAHVTYTSSWAEEGSKGEADLNLAGNRLIWIGKKEPKGEDYTPAKITLKRTAMITKV